MIGLISAMCVLLNLEKSYAGNIFLQTVFDYGSIYDGQQQFSDDLKKKDYMYTNDISVLNIGPEFTFYGEAWGFSLGWMLFSESGAEYRHRTEFGENEGEIAISCPNIYLLFNRILFMYGEPDGFISLNTRLGPVIGNYTIEHAGLDNKDYSGTKRLYGIEGTLDFIIAAEGIMVTFSAVGIKCIPQTISKKSIGTDSDWKASSDMLGIKFGLGKYW